MLIMVWVTWLFSMMYVQSRPPTVPSLMLSQHINLAGLCGINPLRGPHSDELGVRFPALSDAYDLALRQLAHKLWKRIHCESKNRRLHEGVYAYAGGPR